jgi:hypothetical protein
LVVSADERLISAEQHTLTAPLPHERMSLHGLYRAVGVSLTWLWHCLALQARPGGIYGELESGKDVVEGQNTFHLRKQCVSQYVTSRLVHGGVALPLGFCRRDSVLWSVSSVFPHDL